MPWNERGEWVTLDPVQEYKNRVIKSRQEPGSGGYLWTEVVRRNFHNRAAFYRLEKNGLEATVENFFKTRKEIEEELEEEFHCDENNGFARETILFSPADTSDGYRHNGD